MHTAPSGARLEDLFKQIQAGEAATLNLIVKADVTGSLEALTESLRKLERDEVKLSFVLRGVGRITEDDIQLAAAANATIIGFNVRPDRKARELADRENVEIRTYEIIYNVLEDIENAMLGLLRPEFEEVVTGDAEVREVFRVPRVGAVAGCIVLNGTITRGSKVRFLREGTIIWKGTITSLRASRTTSARSARASSAASACPTSRTSRPATSSRPTRTGRSPAPDRPPVADVVLVLALAVELHLPACRSLKDRRAVVRPILDGARHRFRVSAAEVGLPGQVAAGAARLRGRGIVAGPGDGGHRRGGALRLVVPGGRGDGDRSLVGWRPTEQARTERGDADMARRRHSGGAREYPRTARVNELVREIVADELERIDDPRLEWVSVTAVEVTTELSQRGGLLLLPGRARGRRRGHSRRWGSAGCGSSGRSAARPVCVARRS